MSDGERWTRETLAALHHDRYTPAACARFLAASFARAARQGRERPQPRRQLAGVALLGVLAWAGVAAVGYGLVAVAGAGWWLLVVLMFDWHLGMLERPDGRRLDRLGLANVLTLARFWLVPLLPVLAPTGLGIALLVAVALDVVDGPIARGAESLVSI